MPFEAHLLYAFPHFQIGMRIGTVPCNDQSWLRIHFGVIAQDVKAAFEAEGLCAEHYALFCHDVWGEELETWDDEFEIVPAVKSDVLIDLSGQPMLIEPEQQRLIRAAGQKIKIAAGDRFGIRYEQLLAFILAAF